MHCESAFLPIVCLSILQMAVSVQRIQVVTLPEVDGIHFYLVELGGKQRKKRIVKIIGSRNNIVPS
jgi:uncharacterized protein YqhQ